MHLYTAAVMTVVLVFVLAFGHKLNDVLTHALAIRYANMDLIEELKDQTRAAEGARTAAESANLAKSQLLAAASHDLRQPLHALALFTAALAARTRGSELAPLVASVERATAGLDAQFTQLLDLSRLEANAFAPEHGRVALAPLFARLHAEFAPHAAARGLRLTVAPTTLAVDSDPALLLRVLQNLLSNALRYTERGGVLLGARRAAMRLRSTSSTRAWASRPNTANASSRSSTRCPPAAARATAMAWAWDSPSSAASRHCSATRSASLHGQGTARVSA